jgi:hypothetical protein
MNYMREPFRTFSFPLSIYIYLFLSFFRRIWNNKHTTMIVFGAAAFTRPPEQEVVQVPEEKEVSYKNMNSNNCYETTTTTRVVASLFRESFSDVCIYDCCIFVYHILFSIVCMSTRQVSWLTIHIPIRSYIYMYKCAEIPSALKKGERRTMIIIIFHSFIWLV